MFSLTQTFLLSSQFLLICAAENGTAAPDSTGEVVGWQANAPRRGTLDIIINCVTTILACTWSIQHLNIPSDDEIRHSKWGSPWVRWIWHPLQPLKLTWTKTKWTAMTILFPELVLAHSLAEFLMAFESMKDMRCNGGGIPVRYPKILRWIRGGQSDQVKPRKTSIPIPKRFRWTIVHSYYANMGGFHLYAVREDLTPPIREALETYFGVPRGKLEDDPHGDEEFVDICCLTGRQLVFCLDHCKDFKFEDAWISREEIEDKGKAENFAKLIAILQLARLVMSLCLRWSRQLAVSQLEILTLVFAICGVFVYSLYWCKPKGVETPTKIWLKTEYNSGQEPLEDRLKAYGPELRLLSPDRIYEVLKQPNDGRIPVSFRKIRNDNVHRGEWNGSHFIIPVLAALTIVTGALHFIAWHFEFPTVWEKNLWIACCFGFMFLPLIPVLSLPFARKVMWLRGARRFFTRFRHVVNQPPEALPQRLADRDLGRLDRFFTDRLGSPFYSDILNYPDDYDGDTKAYLERHLEEARRLEEVMKRKKKNEYIHEADHVQAFPTLDFGSWAVLFYASIFLYMVARVIMIGLACSTLRAMPDSLYENTWADVIPNVT